MVTAHGCAGKCLGAPAFVGTHLADRKSPGGTSRKTVNQLQRRNMVSSTLAQRLSAAGSLLCVGKRYTKAVPSLCGQ